MSVCRHDQKLLYSSYNEGNTSTQMAKGSSLYLGKAKFQRSDVSPVLTLTAWHLPDSRQYFSFVSSVSRPPPHVFLSLLSLPFFCVLEPRTYHSTTLTYSLTYTPPWHIVKQTSCRSQEPKSTTPLLCTVACHREKSPLHHNIMTPCSRREHLRYLLQTTRLWRTLLLQRSHKLKLLSLMLKEVEGKSQLSWLVAPLARRLWAIC